MITLAVYYATADIILLLQCLIYHRRSPHVDPKHLSPATPLLEPTDSWEVEIETQSSSSTTLAAFPKTQVPAWKSRLFNVGLALAVCFAGALGWYIAESGAPPQHDHKTKLEFSPLGQMFGWLCAGFYLSSRVPQIMLNFKRKSCEGISFLFFMFACLGNATFVISILSLDSSPKYLLVNLPWLVGSFGTLMQDAIIFTQFCLYHGIDDDEEDLEDCSSVLSYQAI